MNSTIVPVVFAFRDSAGERREVQLDYDVAAPPAASDLDVCVSSEHLAGY